MTKVIVDEMKCIKQSTEAGSDDVYLLTWRGQIPLSDSVVTQTEFTVHGGYDFWDDMDTGETRRGDIAIAAYDPPVPVCPPVDREGQRSRRRG
ncbi:hypothetical protein OG563_25945 [Nocardia vinacea]|uniref:Uncharacterized protein n=1 Tax=Nocardia vinacea TaxID=96468 RepID=A0ABZ1YHT7_9NOCA|nr:hypothetical protein [Nocardia vinacea]